MNVEVLKEDLKNLAICPTPRNSIKLSFLRTSDTPASSKPCFLSLSFFSPFALRALMRRLEFYRGDR
jgi:hypothetical protein